MQVYKITLTTVGRNGFNNFVMFGTHHESMSALAHELRENGFILGQRLYTKRTGDNTYEVQDKTDYIVGKALLGTIEVPHGEFIEIVEE
jgi:hypothetical protein